ncbi:hypothetical protein BJY01DRAFT_224473 [Aspergillus pseudoustus]|uniref:Hemerythrin-like domain-containing protein n=1 Tax=Aspergillus pseudoustus TaxID=1810923 RepID=A0ABR4J232_9EURO
MASTSGAWADGPWKLIETPSKTKDVNSHPAIYIANVMAHTHNAMIRGLNSIYLQAEHISDPRDISDFLFFIKAWASWVSHHHVLEEEHMFPGFEQVLGAQDFLQGNVDQHHAFQPALEELLEYGLNTRPAGYSASTVRGLVERLAPAFREHLSDEIDTLLAMQRYDGKGEALLKVYKDAEAEAGKQDKHLVPPLVLGLRDITFEGGNRWPEMPPLSEWFVHYVFARRHAGSWRFLPSDTWGNPRNLAFAGA